MAFCCLWEWRSVPAHRSNRTLLEGHLIRLVGARRWWCHGDKEAASMGTPAIWNTSSLWNPLQEVRRLEREMEQVFSRGGAWRWPLTGEYPPINVRRDDEGISVEALCPGMERSSLDITVVGDSVAIRGERKPAPEVPEERYRRRERPVGAFTRTVSLGEPLDPDRTQAIYADGILRVRLGRQPDARPKKIPIQS
jgi:HSP20 family protein